MSEQELFDLVPSPQTRWPGSARSSPSNFAMIVGIYYFLNRAQIALKLFAFGVYLVGMLLYLAEILLETNVKAAVLRSLAAVPNPSDVVQAYLEVRSSWLGILTIVLFNVRSG